MSQGWHKTERWNASGLGTGGTQATWVSYIVVTTGWIRDFQVFGIGFGFEGVRNY